MNDFELKTLDGSDFDPSLLDGKAVLVVNVASRCGLTPQYEGLEALQKQFGESNFTVLGVPCNQFAGQEPGTPEEIQQFCSATYGTTFPMTEKLDVNGEATHPLYKWLRETPDAEGATGEVQWNFEKFLIAPSGEVVARFRPAVVPQDEQIVSAIQGVLA